MNDCSSDSVGPSRIMSGALAYLALHMESACPRSAYHAALLLNRIASDAGNDTQLRYRAQILADLIETGDTSYARWRRGHQEPSRAASASLCHGGNHA